MTLIQLTQLDFIQNEDVHTIAYCKRAKSAVLAITNIRNSVAESLDKAIKVLKFEIIDFLRRRDLNAADFRFCYQYEDTSDGGMFWWPPQKLGGWMNVI